MEDSAFDLRREEERLNRILAQIESDNEGTRNNAATALRRWSQQHRSVSPGLRLHITLMGTDADRTMRVIDQLERRTSKLQEEVSYLRAFLGESGVKQAELLHKASANGRVNEFVQAVKDMYRPSPPNIPRGAAKAVASVLGCSETTARVLLRGGREPMANEIEQIRAAQKLSLQRVAHPKRRAGRRPSARRLDRVSIDRLNGNASTAYTLQDNKPPVPPT